MTVLVGGLRVLGANFGQSKHGVFTKQPGTLTNDFFVNLLDMGTQWKPASDEAGRLRGARPRNGQAQVDRPRASTWSSARTPSCARWRKSTRATDSQKKFVRDFVAAWDKVMNLDRFDLA